MLRNVQPWPARAVPRPRLRARSLATLHHTTQLSGLPFSRGIPLPPGLHGVQTETTHPMAQTVQSGWPHPCHWASPTRSFAFSSVQPATTCESEVCQPRFVAPALHPTYAPRADTNARLTLGHLTWPIALSDRTGLPPREEKPNRVQPGSTRVYTRA